jgi:hypothetical protein
MEPGVTAAPATTVLDGTEADVYAMETLSSTSNAVGSDQVTLAPPPL